MCLKELSPGDRETFVHKDQPKTKAKQMKKAEGSLKALGRRCVRPVQSHLTMLCPSVLVYCPRQAWTSATEDQIIEISGFMGCVVAVMHSPTPLGVKMVGTD